MWEVSSCIVDVGACDLGCSCDCSDSPLREDCCPCGGSGEVLPAAVLTAAPEGWNDDLGCWFWLLNE